MLMHRSLGLMKELEVSFSYSTGEEIFSSFSLSVEEGEHVLVLSPRFRMKSAAVNGISDMRCSPHRCNCSGVAESGLSHYNKTAKNVCIV